MSSSKTKRRKWQCPVCERRYNIKATAKAPTKCPQCKEAEKTKRRAAQSLNTPMLAEADSATTIRPDSQPADVGMFDLEVECPRCHKTCPASQQLVTGLGVRCPHCDTASSDKVAEPSSVVTASPVLQVDERRLSRGTVAIVGSLLIAIPLLAVLYFAIGPDSKGRQQDNVGANVGLAQIPPNLRDDVREIVRRVDESVVEVEIPGVAIGSGFLVGDGVVATNYHVVEGATSATVRFRDGVQTKAAGFTGVLPKSDLVLLKLEDQPNAVSMRLSSDEPGKGETVLAFGSPKGLAGTVTDGIVSAIRSGDEMANLMTRQVYVGLLEYDLNATWIQTSAPISSGNSGGPLVNLKGEVIGINTWMRKGGQNLNFAISASELQRLIENQHRALSFSLLPAPREWTLAQQTPKSDGDGLQKNLAGIRKQLEQDAEYKRKSDERMAVTERIRQQTVSKAIKSQQTQEALNRINAQIVALRAELAETEKQGTALVASHARIIADAKATYVIGQRVKNTLVQNRIQANNLNSALARQQSLYQQELVQAGNQANLRAGVQRVHVPIVLDLQRKLAAIQGSSASLAKQATGLEARIVALDSNARSLQQQIAVKAQQRAAMISELNGLIESYNQTVGDGK